MGFSSVRKIIRKNRILVSLRSEVENNVVAALVLMAPPFVHLPKSIMNIHFPARKRATFHQPGSRV